MMFYSVSKGQGGRGCTKNIGPDFVGPIHCGALWVDTLGSSYAYVRLKNR